MKALHCSKWIYFRNWKEFYHEFFTSPLSKQDKEDDKWNILSLGKNSRASLCLILPSPNCLITISFLLFSTGPLTIEEKTTQKLAAIDLLNRRGDEFRATEVLERLPNDWSLSALAPALMKMTKASTHRVSLTHILLPKGLFLPQKWV